MNLKLAASFGIVLGGAIFTWQVIASALTVSSMFIPIATGIEAAVMIALFSRPGPGRPVGARIGTGALVALFGAVCALAGSLLCTKVLFPDLLASLPGAPTAESAAMGGFMGTLLTGIALSAALGALQRNRTAAT